MARKSKSAMENIFEMLDQEKEIKDEKEEKPHHETDYEVEDSGEFDLDVTKNPRKQKKKKEETHQRKTFLIEKEMLEWMKKEARRYGHGFYIDFINFSLKLGREKYEEAKKKK